MSKREKDILKKGMEKTSIDFTSDVMKTINKEEQALATVLMEHSTLKPSDSFTSLLMHKLEGKVPAKPYEPVISRFAWITICASVIGFIVLAISMGSVESDYSISNNLKEVSESMSNFFSNSSYLTYTIGGILALSIGLLIDQKVGNKEFN